MIIYLIIRKITFVFLILKANRQNSCKMICFSDHLKSLHFELLMKILTCSSVKYYFFISVDIVFHLSLKI